MPYQLSQVTAGGYQLGYVGAYSGGAPVGYPIDITDLFPCDSNSIGAGQDWAVSDEPVYMAEPELPYLIDDNGDPVSPAVTMAYKAPYTSLADVAAADLLSNDVNDYLQAPEGVSGTFRWDLERIYSDDTVVQWAPTLTVDQDGVISVGGGRKQFRISFGMGF